MAVAASLVYVMVLYRGAKRLRAAVILLSLWTAAGALAFAFWSANAAAVDQRLGAGAADRIGIYAATTGALRQVTPFEAIAGGGFLASKTTTGSEAHNDWLFLQHDFGAVGVLLMLCVYVALLTMLWRLCRARSPLALSLTCSIVLLTCVQLYSSGLYLKVFGFITGNIGLVAGLMETGRTYPEGWGRVPRK